MPKCYYKGCSSTSKSKHFKNLRYHPFPKPILNRARCLIWIDLCGNSNLNISNISKNTYICEKHFLENGSDPTPYVPDIMRDPSSLVVQSNVEIASSRDDENVTQSTSEDTEEHSYARRSSFPMVPLHFSNTSKVNLKEFGNFFLYSSLSQSKHMKYFTGLEITQFEALYNLLDESVMPLLKYTTRSGTPTKNKFTRLSYRDKLCLMLVRLRRGYTLKELSLFYNMSVTNVSVVFYTWVQFVYLQCCGLRNNLIKASRATEKNHMPASFRAFDEKITLVLDSTEVRMQMSRNFQRQGNTHSNYKPFNTIKFLVGISARGAVVYNSEGYEGAISDNALFKESDICNFLEEGDVIMVDRGFTIQDVCNEHKYKLIIPPFLAGRTKLTAEEEVLTKKIAKCRIHVERAIGRIKAFQILSKPIQIIMLPIISNIFNIICFLVNFNKPLVS